MRIRTLMLVLVIASAMIGSALGVVAVLLDDFFALGAELIVTSITVFLMSGIAFLGSLVLERGILPFISWIGLTGTWLGLLSWIFLIWIGDPVFGYEGEWVVVRVAGSLTTIGIWGIYVGLMTWLPARGSRLHLLRQITLCVTSLFGLLLLLVYTGNVPDWVGPLGELIGKVLAITGFVAGGLTVVTVVLVVVQRTQRKQQRETLSPGLSIQVVCPRCETQNTMQGGNGKCTRCSLRIRIEIEEPRCECGYAIYRLESDCCPECGRAIADEDRWLPTAVEGIVPSS